MILVLAIVATALYGVGFHLLLQRSAFKVVLGLALLSHGANVMIFGAAGLVRGRPALVPEGALAPDAPYADPLPPALILTAIVISFALSAFAIVLAKRAYQQTGADDTDLHQATER